MATLARAASLCRVFVATSLDGFISRIDGSIDWLDDCNRRVPAGEDCGYADFMSSVDAIVMGRASFDKVCSFPQWPYADRPVFVLSRTLTKLPDNVPPLSVRLASGTPREIVDLAALAGYRSLYIDGGKTVQDFLASGLIDELIITVVPVLLGSGRSLFGPLPADVRLRHISSSVYPFGFVQSRYARD